jgi:mono/diheme cytochrome c family protein
MQPGKRTTRFIFAVCLIGIAPVSAALEDAISVALLERGTYLVESIAACGNCHTPKNPDSGEELETMVYAGSFMISDSSVTVYAPNITMDIETGIGGWTDEEIIFALRNGFRPDGTLIRPPMPISFYRAISDNDARAIVAYLRTIEPVINAVPESEYSTSLPMNYGPRVGSVPEISRDDPVVYGKYVTHTLGHCTGCHTPRENGKLDFSRTNVGGRFFNNLYGLGFTAVSRNITPHIVTGIGLWTDEEIIRAITKGISRDGRELVKVMGFHYYDKISEDDLDAIVAYLRSLPPLSLTESD